MSTSEISSAHLYLPFINLDDFHGENKLLSYQNQKINKVIGYLSLKLYQCIDLIKQIAYRSFLTLNAICSDPSVLFHVFRRLDKNILPYAEFKKGFDPYPELCRVIRSSLRIFDAIYVAKGLDYFINKKFILDKSTLILANASLFTAHFSLLCREFVYLRLMNLEKISHALGNFRNFGSMPIVLFGAANVFFALNAFDKLNSKHPLVEKRDIQLDLTKNVVDFTLYAMMLSGIVSLGYLCAMGCLSMSLGVSSAFYKYENKKELLSCKLLA